MTNYFESLCFHNCWKPKFHNNFMVDKIYGINAASAGGQLNLVQILNDDSLPMEKYLVAIEKAIEFSKPEIIVWFCNQKGKTFELLTVGLLSYNFKDLCHRGDINVLKLFYKLNYDVDEPYVKVSHTAVGIGLYYAYVSNHENVIDWLIDKFKLKTNKLDQKGLYFFLKEVDSIKWIINKFGKSYILSIIGNPNAQILECCKTGNLEAILLLKTEFQQKSKVLFDRSLPQINWLQAAAIHDHTHIVDWLLSGYGHNLISSNNFSVITECLGNDKNIMAKYLLDYYFEKTKQSKLNK